jgi:hypothetical protein
MHGTQHVEWHNLAIYLLTPQDYQDKSGLKAVWDKPITFCAVLGCVGYTRVGTLEAPIGSLHFPKEVGIHHDLVIALPLFQQGKTTAHCWKRVFPNLLLLLKTQTVTSDSIDHLNNPQAVDYGDIMPWINKTWPCPGSRKPNRHGRWQNMNSTLTGTQPPRKLWSTWEDMCKIF